MATAVTEMIPSLQREVNPPGFAQYPDALPADFIGYIEDGFWEGRLMGVFGTWTIVDGQTLTTPLSGDFITNDDEADFPEPDQMFLVIIAGFRLLQRKAINLAVNFKAKAGPVEYDQQTSATVIRELLQSLERRLESYKQMYSDLIPAEAFYYMDGVAQSSYAVLNDLAALTVRY